MQSALVKSPVTAAVARPGRPAANLVRAVLRSRRRRRLVCARLAPVPRPTPPRAPPHHRRRAFICCAPAPLASQPVRATDTPAVRRRAPRAVADGRACYGTRAGTLHGWARTAHCRVTGNRRDGTRAHMAAVRSRHADSPRSTHRLFSLPFPPRDFETPSSPGRARRPALCHRARCLASMPEPAGLYFFCFAWLRGHTPHGRPWSMAKWRCQCECELECNTPAWLLFVSCHITVSCM